MDRRSFLKTTAAVGLITPASGLALPTIVRAAKPASTRGIWATKFPGNAMMKNNTIQNLPATSSKLYVNYWHKSSVAPTASGANLQVVLRGGVTTDANINNLLEINHNYATGVGPVVLVQMTSSTASIGGLAFRAYGGPLRYDNTWQNIAISVDASRQYAQVVINNSPVTTRIDNGANGTNCSVNWGGGKVFFGAWQKSGNQLYNPLNAAMAEFYVWAPDSAPDPMDPTLQANFMDPNTEDPVYGGPDGGSAFGGLKPIVYFWGGGLSWPWNTPRYDFTWNSMTDNGGNAFTVVAGGPLQTANNDPWGFTGET